MLRGLPCFQGKGEGGVGFNEPCVFPSTHQCSFTFYIEEQVGDRDLVGGSLLVEGLIEMEEEASPYRLL